MWSNGFISASKPSVWEQTTHNGETPLFLAVSNCLLENASFLLLNGCNPNAKNFEGNSPLLTGKLTPCLWRRVYGSESPPCTQVSEAAFCVQLQHCHFIIPTDQTQVPGPQETFCRLACEMICCNISAHLGIDRFSWCFN